MNGLSFVASFGQAFRPVVPAFASALVLALVLACSGPAPKTPADSPPPQLEPGLSNAPLLNRLPSEGLGEDAIANGPQSCPPSGRREDDPLKGRYPRCPESGPIRRLPAKASPPTR